MHGYRCAQQRHEQYDYAPLCIPLNELCDGLKQCPLGDDEHQARCRMLKNLFEKINICVLFH